MLLKWHKLIKSKKSTMQSDTKPWLVCLWKRGITKITVEEQKKVSILACSNVQIQRWLVLATSTFWCFFFSFSQFIIAQYHLNIWSLWIHENCLHFYQNLKRIRYLTLQLIRSNLYVRMREECVLRILVRVIFMPSNIKIDH